MEIDQKKVSQRIMEIMQNRSLNQKQLADQLGITQPAVSQYLKQRIPPVRILFGISQLSGKNMEWLLTGDSEFLSKNQVAEPPVTYDSGINLEQKASLLPKQIYHQIEELVDSILINLSD
jgi:transcriptional regulator with XRE-family HTH domain